MLCLLLILIYVALALCISQVEAFLPAPSYNKKPNTTTAGNCHRRALLFAQQEALPASISSGKRKRSRIPVLKYESNWVCVNKPAGMTVHRGNGTPKSSPVVQTTIKRQLSRKVYPVHRLDHRTSGALLFAFDSDTCGKLHSALRDGDKEYICLVRGEIANNDAIFTVDKPLQVNGIEKDAITEFQVLATYGGIMKNDDKYPTGACSILRAKPKTGRLHQIRRHAFHMGHPIIGDTRRGDTTVNRYFRETFGINRLVLHCLSLKLEVDGDQRLITAPFSEELVTCLEQLPVWQRALDKEPRLGLPHYDETGGTLSQQNLKSL